MEQDLQVRVEAANQWLGALFIRSLPFVLFGPFSRSICFFQFPLDNSADRRARLVEAQSYERSLGYVAVDQSLLFVYNRDIFAKCRFN